MIDYKTTLKAQLESLGLPVYYELFCDSSTETPCITYIESNNASTTEGDTLYYSRVSFTIKLWGNDIAVLSGYATSLDTLMRSLGFARTSANELVVDTQIEKIFDYEASALEYIN